MDIKVVAPNEPIAMTVTVIPTADELNRVFAGGDQDDLFYDLYHKPAREKLTQTELMERVTEVVRLIEASRPVTALASGEFEQPKPKRG